ncbi:MAG: phosphatase PAP2 family protein [Ignavibacteria bacterium]|nr:phosphatase PAP2 family protein [Ignavibacteria bacterium]
MGEILYNIDVSIFYFINQSLSNPFFDKLFVFLTEVKHWYLLYLVLILICFFKGGRIGKIAAIGSIFLVFASDQISSSVLKNLFERVRPCNVLLNVNILVGCNSSFSFPSSHAVNNFAAAFYFGKIFPKYRWILLTVAFLMAISRPYVGVHYPSDIIGGAIIGSIIGFLLSLVVMYLDIFIKNKKKNLTSRFKRVEIK